MDALKGKITSQHELEAIVGISYFQAVREDLRHLAPKNTIDAVSWWAVREKARIHHGIYETTAACDELNKRAGCFVHIASTDRNMVAFTPDRVAGEMDRQVVTTFGKVASKLLPVCTENYIRELAEEHLADLSDDFELIGGDGIADAYSAPGTISSCMVGKDWSQLPESPINLYNIEGVQLAVLRDSSGRITARCLVRHVGEQKLYIRAAYGDPRLKRRLERKGYTPGGWEGCVFRKVVLSEYVSEGNQFGTVKNQKFLMPYLDSYNSTATSQGSTVVNEENAIRCITPEELRSLKEAGLGLFAKAASSSYGYIELPLLERRFLEYYDDMQQKVVKATEAGPGALALLSDNVTIGTASRNSLIDAGWHLLRINNTQRVYCHPDTPIFRSASWDKWADTEAARLADEQVKLCSELYSQTDGVHFGKVSLNYMGIAWVYKSQACLVRVEPYGEVWVRREDAYQLLEDGAVRWVYGQPAKSLRKLAPNSQGEIAYYNPKTQPILRTAKRKAVALCFNDNVSEMYDGNWDFSRSLTSRYGWRGFDFMYTVHRKMTDAEDAAWKHFLRLEAARLVGKEIQEHGFNRAVENFLGIRGKENSRLILTVPHSATRKEGTRMRFAWDEVCSSYQLKKQWLAEAVKIWHNDYYEKGLGEFLNEFAMFLAEGEALDYNTQTAATAEPEKAQDVSTHPTGTDVAGVISVVQPELEPELEPEPDAAEGSGQVEGQHEGQGQEDYSAYSVVRVGTSTGTVFPDTAAVTASTSTGDAADALRTLLTTGVSSVER